MTHSKVILRIQEVAQEKVYRLLRLNLGVSEDETEIQKEEEIQKTLESTALSKRIAVVLGISLEEPGITKVFESLIPEFAKNKALYLLSQVSGISEEVIRSYEASENVDLKEQNTIDDLQKIADVLDVPVVELIRPVVKREAVRLKIGELLSNMTTEEKSLRILSEKTNIEIPILCFYSTQPIEKKKLDEPLFQANLTKISEALNCTIEELQDTNEVDLPLTWLPIQEFVEDRNLTLDDLNILTKISPLLANILLTNPIDVDAIWAWNLDSILGKEALILGELIKIILRKK